MGIKPFLHTMKKILAILLSAFFAVVGYGADTLTIAHKTSLLTVPLKRGSIECNIEADMPVKGGVTLFNNLSQRLCLAVGKATGIENLDKGFEKIQMPALSNMESSFVKYISEQMETQTRDAHAYNLTLDVQMLREYESSQLITFRIDVTYYGLDNKRRQVTDHVSLLKQSGKTLSWNEVLNKKTRPKFCKAVAQSLNGYFGVMDFINLKNALLNGAEIKEDNFPLPENGPAVTRDGLVVSYLPGEIASPDRGQPFGSIRLQSVLSYFTPNAKKWFK